MHDPVVDRYVSAPKIGPRLLSQPSLQIEPDLTVCFVMLIDTADHRCECLDQVGAADDTDEFLIPDDRHALDPVSLEYCSNLRERGILGHGNDTSRHDF